MAAQYRLRQTSCLFLRAPSPSALYTLSLHDALPICPGWRGCAARAPRRTPCRSEPLAGGAAAARGARADQRSEEHTSELQSRLHLVCRLLLEKKKHPKDFGLPLVNHLYTELYADEPD